MKKENELISSLSHGLGFLLSIAGLILLIVFASLHGNAWHIVGFSIFGVSLILLYLSSAVYHFLPIDHKFKKTLQKIDHIMIFVLIAGTYTPICFLFPQRGWGWTLFGLIWGMALIGIFLKLAKIKMAGWLSTLFYILMGWLAVIAFVPIVNFIPLSGLFWLVGGGIFYTLGAGFFGLDKIFPRKKLFGLHEIFHLFVLAGSFFHFWFMLKYALYF